MDYVKGKGYYVGCFDENDIANKLDKKAVKKAKKRNGFKIYKSGNGMQK
jgi:hypothetical protein